MGASPSATIHFYNTYLRGGASIAAQRIFDFLPSRKGGLTIEKTFFSSESTQKKYYRHSGYPGGIKETSFDKMFAAKPEEVVRKAVRGMLPKTTLGRAMVLKMKVYRGGEHPHEAQKPEPFPEFLINRAANGRGDD